MNITKHKKNRLPDIENKPVEKEDGQDRGRGLRGINHYVYNI